MAVVASEATLRLGSRGSPSHDLRHNAHATPTATRHERIMNPAFMIHAGKVNVWKEEEAGHMIASSAFIVW